MLSLNQVAERLDVQLIASRYDHFFAKSISYNWLSAFIVSYTKTVCLILYNEYSGRAEGGKMVIICKYKCYILILTFQVNCISAQIVLIS